MFLARGENLQEDLQSARVVKTIVNRLLFLIVRYWLLKNLKAFYRFDITVVLYMYTVFLQEDTLFSGCGDNNIYMWDLESGTCKVIFKESYISCFNLIKEQCFVKEYFIK